MVRVVGEQQHLVETHLQQLGIRHTRRRRVEALHDNRNDVLDAWHLVQPAFDPAAVQRLPEAPLVGVEEAAPAVAGPVVGEFLLEHETQVFAPDLGQRADDNADLQRHEPRRSQLDVLADQPHRFQVRGDRGAQRFFEQRRAFGVERHANRAPAAGPGITRDRARHAFDFLGAAHVVGQRHRAQLACAIGLGCVAAHLLGRLGVAAVVDVEGVPHALDRAGQCPAERVREQQLVGTDVARRAAADLVFRADRRAARQQRAVGAVAEAQHAAAAFVGLDHEVVALLGAGIAVHQRLDLVPGVGAAGGNRDLDVQRRSCRHFAARRRRQIGQWALMQIRQRRQHPVEAAVVAVETDEVALLDFGGVGDQVGAGLVEHRFHRPAFVDRQQVAVEHRDVRGRHAVAEAGEAVVMAQRVARIPMQPHHEDVVQRILDRLRGEGSDRAAAQPQQLALARVAAVGQPGQRVQPFGDQQLAQAAGAHQIAQRVGFGLAAARHRHDIGVGAAGAQGRLRVAPGVQPQRVDQRIQPALLRGRQPVFAAGEEHRLGQRRVGAGPRHQRLRAQLERALPRRDLEREPGAGLVAFVQVVVHQPRMPCQRDALARGREVGLAHHPVLEVAELVGGGREQVDQHLVMVGLAGALPARHARRHRRHQHMAEGVVVLGQVVDRRAGQGRAAGQQRRAVVGETTGAELEAQRGEERVDAAGVEHQFERVGRVVADRCYAQVQPRRFGAGRHRADMHLVRQVAGEHARAAAHAEDLAGAHRVGNDLGQDRGDVQAVPEAQLEIGMVGVRPRRQRDQDQPHAVQVGRDQRVGAVVGVVAGDDGAHRRSPLIPRLLPPAGEGARAARAFIARSSGT